MLSINGINSIPDSTLLNILSFMEPCELARSEEVCHSWRVLVMSEDQYAWKEQCAAQGISVISPHIAQVLGSYISENVKGKFDDRILELITEYEEIDYKKQAMSLFQAKVEFDPESFFIQLYQKQGALDWLANWGNSDPEPFVVVNIFSSLGGNVTERRNWHENPPRGVEPTKTLLPLRFFINRDGSYKGSGDKVRIVWKGIKIMLTCFYEQKRNDPPLSLFRLIEVRSISSFEEAIAVRVGNSPFVVNRDVLAQAKAAAAAASKWIDSK